MLLFTFGFIAECFEIIDKLYFWNTQYNGLKLHIKP